MIEVLVALALIGICAGALLTALAQSRRTIVLSKAWAEDEIRATDLMMSELRRWEQRRDDEARREAMRASGQDDRLGCWTWEATLQELRPQDPAAGLYRIRLAWPGSQGTREVRTYAVLRPVR